MQTIKNTYLLPSKRSQSDWELYQGVRNGEIKSINTAALNQLLFIVPHAIYANDKEFLDRLQKVAPTAIFHTDSFIAAAGMGNLELLRILLEKTKSLGSYHSNKHVWTTAFKCALENRHIETLKLLLTRAKFRKFTEICATQLAGGDLELTKILLQNKKAGRVDLQFACHLKNIELIELTEDIDEDYTQRDSEMYNYETLSLHLLKKEGAKKNEFEAYKSDMMYASAAKSMDVVNYIMAKNWNANEKRKLQAIFDKWSQYPNVPIQPNVKGFPDDEYEDDFNSFLRLVQSPIMYPWTNAQDMYIAMSPTCFCQGPKEFLYSALALDDHKAIDLACKLINEKTNEHTFYNDGKYYFNMEYVKKSFWMATKSEKARKILCEQPWLELDRANFQIVGDIHYIMMMPIRIHTEHHKTDITYGNAYINCYLEFRLNNLAATKTLVIMSYLNKTNNLCGMFPHEIWKNILSFLCYEKIDMMKPPFVVMNSQNKELGTVSFRAKQCFAEMIQEERCKTTIAKAFGL